MIEHTEELLKFEMLKILSFFLLATQLKSNHSTTKVWKKVLSKQTTHQNEDQGKKKRNIEKGNQITRAHLRVMLGFDGSIYN